MTAPSPAAGSPPCPQYYGYYVALLAGLPAFVLFLAGVLFQGSIIDALLLGSLPAEMTTDITAAERNLLLSSIKNAAQGTTFGTPPPEILAAAETLGTYRLDRPWRGRSRSSWRSPLPD